MNTANKLTILRVLLIPVFLLLLYNGFEYNSFINNVSIALFVFCLASMTDLADGIVARRRNQVTDFGKFMDPLADKVLTFAAMLWFVEVKLMPAWLVLIIVIREFLVTGIRLVGAAKGVVIDASWMGKIKTACTMISIISIFIIFMVNPGIQWPLIICWVLIGVPTVISGIEYCLNNRSIMSMSK